LIHQFYMIHDPCIYCCIKFFIHFYSPITVFICWSIYLPQYSPVPCQSDSFHFIHYCP
jgi:hypothetical protein